MAAISRRSILILSMLVFILHSASTYAVDSQFAPMLRIETGAHTARITSMASKQDGGSYLVTGSVDKTVRVWKMNNGSLEIMSTIQPPLGEGGVGKIYAVAISPDERLIAFGGWTASGEKKFNVYIYRRYADEFKYLQTISNLPASITDLAFAKNYLLVGLSGSNGLKIYRLSDFSLAAEDTEYAERVNDIDFTKDGIVSVSEDGKIRFYGFPAAASEGWGCFGPKDPQKMTPTHTIDRHGQNPISISYLNKGEKSFIAVGFDLLVKQEVTQGKQPPNFCVFKVGKGSAADGDAADDITEAYPYCEDNPHSGIREPLSRVKWASDGMSLYVLKPGRDATSGRIYRKIYEYKFFADSKSKITRHPDIKEVLVGNGGNTDADGFVLSGDSIIYVFDSTDVGVYMANKLSVVKTVWKAVNFKRLKNLGLAFFAVSEDGAKIQYVDNQANQYEAVVSETTVTGGDFRSKLSEPREIWKAPDTCDKVSINGRAIQLNRREVAKEGCVSTSWNNELFIIGTSWNLRLYNNKGEEQSALSLPASAYAVRLAQTGKLIVAALGDGTIRWYRIDDRKDTDAEKVTKELTEILSFFPLNGKADGVFWTPSGYFTQALDTGKNNIISLRGYSEKEQRATYMTCGNEFDKKISRLKKPAVFKWIVETQSENEALERAALEENSFCLESASHQIAPWFPEMKDWKSYYKEHADSLKRYLGDPPEKTQASLLKKDLSLYLKTIETGTGFSNLTLRVAAAAVVDNTTIIMPEVKVSAQGSWESELMAGLTDFIFERAEEEMITWYVKEIAEKLCNADRYASFGLELCRLTSEMEASGRFSRSILFNAIRKDLESLPSEIVCRLNMSRDQQLFTHSLINVVKKVSKGTTPANMIAGLGESEEIRQECLKNEHRPLSCSLYLSGVMMQAYLGAALSRDQDPMIYWNDIFVQMYEKLDRDWKDNKKEPALMDRIIKKHREIKSAITMYREILQEQQRIAKDLRAWTPGEDKNKYADILSPALRMCRSVVDIVSSIYPVLEIKPEVLEYATMVSNTTVAIGSGHYADATKYVRDIINYSSVGICESIPIPDMDCTFKNGWIVKQFDEKYANFKVLRDDACKKEDCPEKDANEPDCQLECQRLETIVNKISHYDYDQNKTMERLKKFQPVYEHFPIMGELANVKTKEDVKAVLNDVASPVGAWTMKERKNVWSLGSLVGGQYSYELISNEPNGIAVGLFAPIGIDWTMNSNNMFCGSYCGFFVSIADLGNYASARYSNTDDVETRSDTGWPQAVSLGAYFHRSLVRHSPIAIGLGYSYAPQLRTVRTDSGGSIDKGSGRVMAFIAIDVTLWPF